VSIIFTHQSETFIHLYAYINKGLYLSLYAMVCKLLGTINKYTNKWRKRELLCALVKVRGKITIQKGKVDDYKICRFKHLLRNYSTCEVVYGVEIKGSLVFFVNNQLDAQFFFMYVYFYSLHVSGSHVPIIRRINCINKTSGICHSV
jgi:hypothetical protein